LSTAHAPADINRPPVRGAILVGKCSLPVFVFESVVAQPARAEIITPVPREIRTLKISFVFHF